MHNTGVPTYFTTEKFKHVFFLINPEGHRSVRIQYVARRQVEIAKQYYE